MLVPWNSGSLICDISFLFLLVFGESLQKCSFVLVCLAVNFRVGELAGDIMDVFLNFVMAEKDSKLRSISFGRCRWMEF